MKKISEQTVSLFFSIVGSLAIIINLLLKGYSHENILDAIKDLAGLFITIAIFVVAHRIRKSTISYLESGKNALIKLYDNYIDYFEGPPKSNRSNENTEGDDNKSNKYLFIKKRNHKFVSKVTFIPLADLEDGVLDIRVSKGTLVNLDKEGSIDEIKALQQKVHSNVLNYLDKIGLAKGQDYELIESKNQNSAIIIDFNERNLGHNRFEKVIYKCGEIAIQCIFRN